MNKKELRYKTLLQYLQTHKNVKSQDLLEELGIKKSSLSEDIKILKDKGYPIDTSKHGYVSLKAVINDIDISYNEEITPAIIRKWLILYAINILTEARKEPTYKKIYNKLVDLYNINKVNINYIKKYMLGKDIRFLVDDSYIKCCDEYIGKFEEKTYKSAFKSTYISRLQKHKASKIIKELKYLPESILYTDLKKKIYTLFPNTTTGESSTSCTNNLTTALKSVTDIIQSNYEEVCLSFTYLNKKNKNQIAYFETGAIIYSYDKNRFYLLGRQTINSKKKKENKIFRLLRADKISNVIAVPNSINRLYDSDDINYIINHIFETSIEEGPAPKGQKVELLFSNTEQNQNRIRILSNSRNQNGFLGISTFEIINNMKDYSQIVKNNSFDSSNGIIRYNDTILGLKDLQRFIRGFDNEVIVKEPTNIKESIKNRKVYQKEAYETTFRKEYGENINECIYENQQSAYHPFK